MHAHHFQEIFCLFNVIYICIVTKTHPFSFGLLIYTFFQNLYVIHAQLEEIFTQKRAEIEERQHREMENLQAQQVTNTTSHGDDSKNDKVGLYHVARGDS